MAAGSSSSAAMPTFAFGFLPPVSEKLTRANYNMWHAQVSSTIKGAQMGDYIKTGAAPPPALLDGVVDATTGKKGDPVPNPAYQTWMIQDQQVLSYLFSSLSKEIFAQVSSATTAAAIHAQHASQSRARIISTRMALATASKGTSSVADYYTKMKGLADDMASAGKKLEDEDLVTYILTGLGEEFESIITVVANRVEPITVPELYAQLIAHEQRKELNFGGGTQSSVNAATKGNRSGAGSSNNPRRDGGNRGGFGRGGGGRGRGNNYGGGGTGHGRNFQSGVLCQICGKEGHPAYRCRKRFDNNYNGPPQKSVSSATSSSYGIDTNWYVDSGATDHITGELERLTTRNKYHGGDNVHAADGAGMEIAHVGHSTVSSPSRVFHLNNVLHVPQANKSLCSVNQLARDNHVYLEFHPDHFLIKEQGTMKTLHRGRCEGGLYPLHASSTLPSASSSNKQVYTAVKPSTSLWHRRLGHASSRVVQHVLDRHRLSFVLDSNNQQVCDACQQGKSHQLPYSQSVSRSKGPLDLIFSDVWGRAPTSVGRFEYYVSFIDDYSKFTWIYLIRHKSEVFKCFHTFQALVER